MSTRAAQAGNEPDLAQMGAAGIRAFTRIAALWGLSIEEQLALLGEPARSTFFAWRKHPERASLPRDTLERISNLLGIYKALQILFPDPTHRDAGQPGRIEFAVGGIARMLRTEPPARGRQDHPPPRTASR